MQNSNIFPFVKWAGGKRQLLNRIRERMPLKYNCYHEPFVGGGAVYFDLLPCNATINDINRSLINSYRVIQLFPTLLCDVLKIFDREIISGKKEYFYKIRETYNDKLMKEEYDVELAAMFIFLNKHCFNGLYRVNGKGLFNVPYNNSIAQSFTEDNIYAISKQLQSTTILDGDFEVACNLAQKDDFVFIDSPYSPLKPTSFESYTKEGFDIESHIRLASTFKSLTQRGCYCMLTNHNTDFINKLYSEFNKEIVDAKRMINSDASNRIGTEIIITNY